MDVTLKSLLQPNGDALKPIPYAMAYSLVGASGPLVVAVQYKDYLWATDIVFFSTVCALLLIATGYAVSAAFGERLPTGIALAITVVAGCLLAQLLELHLTENLVKFTPHPEKTYWYRLGL